VSVESARHPSAPKYRGLTGLVHKYYLFDAYRHTGGGVFYLQA